MNVNIKIYASVLIVALAVLSVPLATIFLVPSYTGGDQQSGIVIDFADNDVIWAELSFDEYSDPISALEYACDLNGLSYDIEDGVVWEIDGYESSMAGVWELWVVDNGSNDWRKSDTDINNSDYSLVCWAYRTEGFTPNVGVDYLGKSVYGYSGIRYIVTIAPSVTEIVSSIGASELIVGTDMYSNYPSSVESRKDSGEIRVVGGYTNPSFEEVVRCGPDLVFCYGGQQLHIELAERLRSVGYNVVVMYDGEDVDTILDNIYLAGAALNYGMSARGTIESISSAYEDVTGILDADRVALINVMLSLSATKSPWISGDNTYLNDVLVSVHGSNVYHYKNGWVQATSESIVTNNPSLIIIVGSEFKATQKEYDTLLEGMEREWKSTDAYKNGDIYLYCEILGDIAQRPCPRVAQVMEIMARTLHGDSFSDGIVIPKFIGDNYKDYLTYTKDLDFNE